MHLLTFIYRKQTRNWCALMALVLINSLFVYKYLGRELAYPLMVTLVLFTFQILVYANKNHRFLAMKPYFIFFIQLIITGFVVIYAHYKIPVMSLNVDRWSVIDSFISTWEAGVYPYFAKSHVGNIPGPMPFYYLLAYPFVKLGELGWFSAIGYLIMGFWVAKKASSQDNALLVIMLTSLFAYWELMVRSNIFTNAALVMLLMHYIEKHGVKLSWKGVVLALITGFLLSTRSIFSLVYLVFFVSYLFRGSVKIGEMLVFGLIAIGAFGLTFLPLILQFPGDFLTMNPFIVQSTFLIPVGYTIMYFLVAILLGAISKTKGDRFFYAGLSLLVSIAVYFFYLIFKVGFHNAYIESYADISYFILCLPFFFYYLSLPKTETE